MTKVAAIVLAAGTASRYRALDPTVASKLVADFRGKPLVRYAVEAAVGSRADPVIVVTGHAGEAVVAALADLAVRFVHNPDYATGLASSLKAGVMALPPSTTGAIVLLGDMPLVAANLVDELIAAFDRSLAASAVVPLSGGARGNPVLLGRVLFPEVMDLGSDEGARRLLRDRTDVVEVVIGDADVFVDFDTPDRLAGAGAA